jgi:hypothetical protein
MREKTFYRWELAELNHQIALALKAYCVTPTTARELEIIEMRARRTLIEKVLSDDKERHSNRSAN